MKKIISSILCAAVLITLAVVPLNSYAAESKIVSSSSSYNDIESTASDFNMIDVDEEDVKVVRDGLLAHEAAFSITESVSVPEEEYIRDYADSVFEKALEHTGNPVGGDYIRYQIASHSYEGSISGTQIGNILNLKLTISYNVKYIATKEQEKELETKIDDVLSELNVYKSSEYEKIKAVYDYMTQSIEYDFDSLKLEEQGSDDLTAHSAYAALCKNKAVCQGYATALYRMLLSLGVDCRIITGVSYSENHAWNIAKIGDKYYLLDSTWDSNREENEYFLKAENHFANHYFNKEYKTDEFKAKYPISADDYDNEKIDPVTTPDTPKPHDSDSDTDTEDPKPKPHDSDSDTDTEDPKPKPHDSDSDTDTEDTKPKPHDSDSDTDTEDPKPKPHDSDSDTDTEDPKPKPHDSDSDTDTEDPKPKPHDSDSDTDTEDPKPKPHDSDSDTDTEDPKPKPHDSDSDTDTDTDKPAPSHYRLIGDIDDDGTITAADSLIVLRISVKLDPVGNNGVYADVNEDGYIDSEDALDILRYSVKLSTTSIKIGKPNR